MRARRWIWVSGLIIGAVGIGLALSKGRAVATGDRLASTGSSSAGSPTTSPLPVDALAIAKDRQLSPTDINAALETYMPTGRYDDYLMFASGGHSGQMFVIGLPSMRVLRVIAVFTPEPWEGYGFGGKEHKIKKLE